MRLGRRAAAAIAAAVLVPAVWSAGPAASAQVPVVRAVLFFSLTCGHCEYVIDELLLPVWFPQYGGEAEIVYDESLGEEAPFLLGTNGTLEVLFVNVTTEAGHTMHLAAGEALGIPEQRLGSVPRLVVGDRYLIGSRDIPDEFPGIIEDGLASGGIDWPDLPGIEDALAAIPPAEAVTTTTTTTTTGAAVTSTTAAGSTTTSTTAVLSTTTSGDTVLSFGGGSMWERFSRDEAANSLALIVLGLMLLSLVGAGAYGRQGSKAGGPGLALPLLALLGLGVAIYLAIVETGGLAAVCGPVGDCHAVQQSEWARVFGVPVGIIGVAGYGAVLAAWGLARFGPTRLADWARVALLAGAAAGVGFSVYLTFLEPFVIGATCMWCLGSAVVATLLLWLAVRPGVGAWRRLRGLGDG